MLRDESHLARFHAGWREDSRARTVFFKPSTRPPLRFCVAAFRAADHLAVAFVDTQSAAGQRLARRLDVRAGQEAIVILHEAPEPVFSYSAGHLSRAIIDSAMLQHSRLSVPRILSPARLLDICPVDGRPPSSAFASVSEEINFRAYRLDHLPATRTTPLLLLGYSHFCFACQRVRPLWSRLAEELTPLGVTVSVANIQDDHALREELRLLHAPGIIAVVDSKIVFKLADEALVAARLSVDRYPRWLGWILESATNIPFRPQNEAEEAYNRTTLTFNPANCRGTVLAVNGRRRYFSAYHPLLPGSGPRTHSEGEHFLSFPLPLFLPGGQQYGRCPPCAPEQGRRRYFDLRVN
nr:unnamed protein product [Spirometra erinaceieuropaei]